MEQSARTGFYDILASRKAEDAVCRRFQAVTWLENLVGSLGMSKDTSEREFISCLRNGLILCHAINKVHPGAVPKIVENHAPLQSMTRESQPLPAYQYFENVRNFLVAVEELKLPAFEASDLERDSLEAGSVAKVVDCILALKSYYECKQLNNGNGCYKPMRSPLVMHPSSWNNSQSISSDSCRRLDMSVACEKQELTDFDAQRLEDFVVKKIAEHMVHTKENFDEELLTSFRNGNMDPLKFYGRIISSCLEDRLQSKFPELKSISRDIMKENSNSFDDSTGAPLQDLSECGDSNCCRACSRKGTCSHRYLFQMQEKELLHLKTLLTNTKKEFKDLQSHLQRDLGELGVLVEEMSTSALGYHKVLNENRNLYNMVQDLKGNIRVYCRIRPVSTEKSNNVVDFIGKDGSLVIQDPLKPQKDGKKVFQFNRVFGPTVTQDEVFKDTQPLIRSVMDGYNVCIFAYGQTGSGKTYTMSGPQGGSSKDMGINYLALNYLFQMSEARNEIINYDIHVQMVEIYNEQVRDLLAEDSSATKLEIRSCTGDNGLNLPDARTHSVKSTEDVLRLMKLGEINRVVSSTAINNRSSRSHSVLTVHVHGKDVSGSTLRSCLHLVDLAGSERVDKSEVTGDRLKEAQYINKSLSCLGDVITALAQKNAYIPYRNSKLTLLLQDSLGGNAKTLMFAHVSPEGDSFSETVSTLKFAQRVSTVELGAARANKESSEIMQLREQVENLRKALASKEAQNAHVSKIKEPRSPSEKLKSMTEQTPPRLRRLSVEGGSNLKFEKPKALTERTPPRLRRLSIENGSSTKSERMDHEDVRGSKMQSVSSNSRRLSLEGPRYGGKRDNFQKNATTSDNKRPYPETTAIPKFGSYQDEILTKSYGVQSANGSSMIEVYHVNAPGSPTSSSYQKHTIKTDSAPRSPTSSSYQKHARKTDSAPRSPTSSSYQKHARKTDSAPRSPTSSSYQKYARKADSRTHIPHHHLPTTPTKQVVPRNEVQSVMHSELAICMESQTSSLVGSATGKGSQIRRSLRTIGKLINGSEKRNQMATKEVPSCIDGTNHNDDARSPPTTNARALRRQSLTGTFEYDRSRRSSLGGKSNDPDDSRKSAKTPPPVHSSSIKTAKRWL